MKLFGKRFYYERWKEIPINDGLESKLFSDLEKFRPKMAKNMWMCFETGWQIQGLQLQDKISDALQKIQVRFLIKFLFMIDQQLKTKC